MPKYLVTFQGGSSLPVVAKNSDEARKKAIAARKKALPNRPADVTHVTPKAGTK